MFWGATLQGGKTHSQKVEHDFFVTTAALKVPVPQQDSEKIYPVYVNYNGKEFLLCSLVPSSGIYQVALGIQFEAGAKLEFRVEGGGSSRVYLTGYTMNTQQIPINSTLVSTPYASSAVAIPIKAQQSILVSDKKANARRTGKRVSIRDAHEEKTFEKDSDEDEDELDSDEDEEGMFEDVDESDEDMFNLEESDDDDDDDDDGDLDEFEFEEQSLVDEEEPSFGSPEVANGNADATVHGDKKKNKGKLNFSEDEPSPSPKKGVQHDKKPISPPTKKQKMDDSKNKTPPEGMKTPEHKKHLKPPSSAGHTPMKMLTKGGVMIMENKIGNGPQAKAGKKVKVNYVGRLKKNDHVFDRGDIGFHLGKSEVIKGWDIGIEGMKVGGKRKLVIPPHLAYGKTGAPPDIPPNSTLVFEVELKQA